MIAAIDNRLCIPFRVATCTSMYQSFWRPWEDSKKNIWVRSMPKKAMTKEDFPFYNTTMWDYEFQMRFAQWIHNKNDARQSVQFFIFSKEYEKIADRITKETHRGVTVLDGIGWYSKHNVKVLVVLAYKRQSVEIFRMVKDIDPNAFISQSSVIEDIASCRMRPYR